jgi:hypothetical protein
VQRLGDRVHLGLVLAGGAHPLPQERDGIQPEHLDPEVGQPQDDLGELGQHGGVGPVEVPLPLVERRPDPALELVVPREAAGSERREHLGQGPLVLVGQVAVGEDVEVVAVRRRLGSAGPGPHGPVVLAGDVVEDQVDDQADSLAAQRRGELPEVLGGPEVGPDRAVVAHGVAPVVVPLPGLEQGHQVQVGDAELLEVVEVLGDALEVSREPVGVAGVAEHPRLLQPVRREQPALVELVQVVRALGVRRRRGAHQPRQQVTSDLGVGVHLGDRGLEVGPVAVQPHGELLPPVGAQSPRADERVQAVGTLELAGRGGMDLARCTHRSHPRIAPPPYALGHARTRPLPAGRRCGDRGGGGWRGRRPGP